VVCAWSTHATVGSGRGWPGVVVARQAVLSGRLGATIGGVVVVLQNQNPSFFRNPADRRKKMRRSTSTRIHRASMNMYDLLQPTYITMKSTHHERIYYRPFCDVVFPDKGALRRRNVAVPTQHSVPYTASVNTRYPDNHFPRKTLPGQTWTICMNTFEYFGIHVINVHIARQSVDDTSQSLLIDAKLSCARMIICC